MTAEQRSGLLDGQFGQELPRPEGPVGGAEPSSFHDRFRDRASLLVDHVRRATDQARAGIGLEGGEVGTQVARVHHVVLMEDRDERRPALRDALVPVPRQAEPLGVDHDPEAVARLGAEDFQGRVVGAVVAGDPIEGHVGLRPDAPHGLGQVSGPVVGGHRHGDLRGIHAAVPILRSHLIPAIDCERRRRVSQVYNPEEWPSFQPRRTA